MKNKKAARVLDWKDKKSWAVLLGPAHDVLQGIPDKSIHCCITSPPYWTLRSADIESQIGQEKDLFGYMHAVSEVMKQVHLKLRDDGTLWFNIGDCYAKEDIPQNGIFKSELMSLPFRIAAMLQRIGFRLRSDIIWHKPNPMPSSSPDRLTSSHEHLFLFAKGETSYYFDTTAILEPAATGSNGSEFHKGKTGKRQKGSSERPREYDETKRRKRDVWTIPVARFEGSHFSVFPEKLVEPCILAGTSEAGCCPKCGNPLGRMVEKTRVPTRPGKKSKLDRGGDHKKANRDRRRHITTVETTGWEQSCVCRRRSSKGKETDRKYPPIPCVVLDPFCGSGTTGFVAKKHNRRFIGIDIDPACCKMARERIKGATS